MYIVECGFLFQEKPLLKVGFYRKEESLNDLTKKKIFMGIFSILPELFNNSELKKIELSGYTVLFRGILLGGKIAGSKINVKNIILCYMIIDLEDEGKDQTNLDVVKEKMETIANTFLSLYKDIDFTKNITNIDFKVMEKEIRESFKDMLDTPSERLKNVWGE